MEYSQYIIKRRMKVCGISGPVNIRWGAILPAEGGYILHDGKLLCATSSQNAKDYFWGYDPANPEAEIKRQEAVAALLAAAPKDDGDALADLRNPWVKYGKLEQKAGGWAWSWCDAVEDLPHAQLEHLLACVRSGEPPQEVRA